MLAVIIAFLLGGIVIPVVALLAVAHFPWQVLDHLPWNKRLPQIQAPSDDATADALQNEKPAPGSIVASGYVYFSETYISMSEAPSGETVAAAANSTKDETARSSLKKIVRHASRASLRNVAVTQTPAQTNAAAKAASKPASKPAKPAPKSVAKLPRYWGEVGDGRFVLYTTQTGPKRRIVKIFVLAEYVVTIWPLNAQDFELFYRRSAITLIPRAGNGGLVSLDMTPGEPPSDAIFIYMDNPTDKEDLYFSLVEECRSINPDESLGPRDPLQMARPLKPTDAEVQAHMKYLYQYPNSPQTVWLNAFLGRMFLAVKDSKQIEDYIRRKIIYKLNRVNSSYLGEVEVKHIDPGNSVPYITDVALREFTPEGNLLIEAGVSYNGGFSVKIATTPNLKWVSGISIELAVALQSLQGRILVRVKPPPSSRIWYAFESMPKMDLLIEPVVQQTQLKYSIITNAFRSRFQEILRETMVMPYMDDVSFFDTSEEFFRGGIWDSRGRTEPTPNPACSSTSGAGSGAAAGSSSASASDDDSDTGLETTRRRPQQHSRTSSTTSIPHLGTVSVAGPSRPTSHHQTSSVGSTGAVDVNRRVSNASQSSVASSATLQSLSSGFGTFGSLNGSTNGSNGSAERDDESTYGSLRKWSNWSFRRNWKKNDPSSDAASIRSVSSSAPSIGSAPRGNGFAPVSESTSTSTNASTTAVTAATVTVSSGSPSPARRPRVVRKPVPVMRLDHRSSPSKDEVYGSPGSPMRPSSSPSRPSDSSTRLPSSPTRPLSSPLRDSGRLVEHTALQPDSDGGSFVFESPVASATRAAKRAAREEPPGSPTPTKKPCSEEDEKLFASLPISIPHQLASASTSNVTAMPEAFDWDFKGSSPGRESAGSIKSAKSSASSNGVPVLGPLPTGRSSAGRRLVASASLPMLAVNSTSSASSIYSSNLHNRKNQAASPLDSPRSQLSSHSNRGNQLGNQLVAESQPPALPPKRRKPPKLVTVAPEAEPRPEPSS